MKKRLPPTRPLIVASALILLACSQEIESDLDRDAREGIRLSLASNASAAAVEDGFQTFLFSERDVDVYSRFGSGDYFEQGVVVENIHVEVGDAVQAGQLLATLDDDEVAIELEAAQAAADEADANFSRIELMREREVVPQAEYDQALYAKRYADAQLKRAQLDHSRTRVRAPFAGVVAKRYIRVAELIEGSTPLFRITAMTPLRARILVPETRAADFRAGAPATVIGSDGQIGTGRVIVVSPTVDPGSGTREVIVELSEPNGFRPGAAISVAPVNASETVEP